MTLVVLPVCGLVLVCDASKQSSVGKFKLFEKKKLKAGYTPVNCTSILLTVLH
jgi:hypothetical protein